MFKRQDLQNHSRHSSESWNPVRKTAARSAANLRYARVTAWIPAFAGMTTVVWHALGFKHNSAPQSQDVSSKIPH